jgi:hypothetical protein
MWPVCTYVVSTHPSVVGVCAATLQWCVNEIGSSINLVEYPTIHPLTWLIASYEIRAFPPGPCSGTGSEADDAIAIMPSWPQSELVALLEPLTGASSTDEKPASA